MTPLLPPPLRHIFTPALLRHAMLSIFQFSLADITADVVDETCCHLLRVTFMPPLLIATYYGHYAAVERCHYDIAYAFMMAPLPLASCYAIHMPLYHYYYAVYYAIPIVTSPRRLISPRHDCFVITYAYGRHVYQPFITYLLRRCMARARGVAVIAD